MIKSTYNFVPAPIENQVYKPDWANQVSHDIPFSDGESGEIELTLTAKTPIFIRNGHSKKDAEQQNDKYLSFSNIQKNGKKEFFIPATSLKGMFRNVFEIITKSKMSQVQDHRHSVRQIMKTKDNVVDEGYQLADEKRKIRAGWLKYENDDYYIYDAGIPLKIRYTDIDDRLQMNFESYFKKNGKANLKDNFSNRTACYKYEVLRVDYNKSYNFENHPLDGEEQSSWVSEFQPLSYARFPESNDKIFEGHIVCSGQASDYSVSTSRKGEYVFKGNKTEILNNSSNKTKISKNIVEAFLLVNRHNKSDELEDWTYFKEKVYQGIPVFFRLDNEKKNEVKDFGLTFMYKQPAIYSVKEQLPLSEYNLETFDLSELVFGSTEKGKELKGRVFFSNAICQNDIDESKIKTERVVMGSPKSSYFPFYLQQSGKNGKLSSYNTYNVKSKLSGFKKYYVHKYAKNLENIIIENENMASGFKPLPKETTFKAIVRFHNLRKIELGALLSAITLHNQNKDAYHSIGYAKPFGYGKMMVDIKFNNHLNYLLEFEKAIRISKKDWSIKNWSISNFINMAKEQYSDISYMELADFQKAKNEGLYLEKVNSHAKDINLLSEEDLKNEIIKLKEEELLREKEERLRKERIQKDREKPFYDAKKIADNLFSQKKYKEAVDAFNESIAKAKELNIDYIEVSQSRNKCIREVKSKEVLHNGLNISKDENSLNAERKNIEKYFKANGSISKGEDLTKLKFFIARCYVKSNKRWKKFGKQDWHLVIKWVGRETAKQWYNEIVDKG